MAAKMKAKKQIKVKPKSKVAFAPQGCIYLLRNLINGKGYVGKHETANAQIRWDGHIKSALVKKSNYAIHCAIRKYGPEKFSAEVIWRGPVSQLNWKETYYIKKLKTLAPNGYNLTEGGQGGAPSEIVRKKLQKSAYLQWANEAIRAKHAVSPELAAQIQASMFAAYERDPTLRARVSAGVNAAYAAGLAKRTAAGIKAAHDADPTYRVRAAEGNKRAWASDGFRDGMVLARLTSWEKPAVRALYITARVAAWANKTEEERAAWGAAIKAGWARRKERKATKHAT